MKIINSKIILIKLQYNGTKNIINQSINNISFNPNKIKLIGYHVHYNNSASPYVIIKSNVLNEVLPPIILFKTIVNAAFVITGYNYVNDFIKIDAIYNFIGSNINNTYTFSLVDYNDYPVSDFNGEINLLCEFMQVED